MMDEVLKYSFVSGGEKQNRIFVNKKCERTVMESKLHSGFFVGRTPYEREDSNLKGFVRIYLEYLCYPVTKEFRARLYDEMEKSYENACKELRLNKTNYEELHIV